MELTNLSPSPPESDEKDQPHHRDSNQHRYQQLRGLVIHFHKEWPTVRLRQNFKRPLLPPFHTTKATGGTCRWCKLPTGREHLKWHPNCVHAYRAAAAQSLRYLWAHVERPGCPCGQPGQELDHKDALILAWTSGDPRRLVRAYSLDNILWLCRPCHREKTTNDLRLLSSMRATHVCLIGLIPAPQDPSMGINHWVLAEGGLAINIKKSTNGQHTATNTITRRRGPVTYRPETATCPRCLAALERPRPQPWLIQLPTNWRLHESKAATEKSTAEQEQLPLI